MSKLQKKWLWVSIIMFIISEIFFSFIPTFFTFILGYGDFPSLISKVFSDNFLESNPIITLLFLVIEYVSLISIFVFNIRFNNQKTYKYLIAIFLGLNIIILSLVIALVYTITHMSFP
jgi:hypothetical protein